MATALFSYSVLNENTLYQCDNFDVGTPGHMHEDRSCAKLELTRSIDAVA